MNFDEVEQHIELAFADEKAGLNAYPGKEGFRFLKDGDHLIIFNKVDPKIAIWAGSIALQPNGDQPDNRNVWRTAANAAGWGQREWLNLFMYEFPAELRPTQDS